MTNKIIASDRYELLQNEVFGALDVTDATRRDYRVRVKHFIRYAQTQGINRHTYLDYKRHLAGIDTYSVSTKNKYLIAAKIFLDGLYRLNLIPRKITDHVRGFTQSRLHRKEGLQDADIEKLQRYCSDLPTTPQNLRLRALVALFLFQGLRQIEVVRLDIADIDLRNRIAFIRGKGHDDKEPIHLHPSTVRVLRAYMNCYRFRSGALFRSDCNRCHDGRLTTTSVREIIKRVFAELEIDGSTHGFRHYFITKLIKAYKGELLMVSKYSRHRSIQMLEVYNDEIIREEDLPRFYEVFNRIRI